MTPGARSSPQCCCCCCCCCNKCCSALPNQDQSSSLLHPDYLDTMPLDTTAHARVIDLMLTNGQPALILFRTNQRVAGAGQPRWRLVICGDLGTVGETDLADSGDLSNGIWVREYDRRRADHVGGKKKFFKFELISGIRMLQPSEFFLKTGAKYVRLEAGTKYHLPDFEDGTVNLWPEGEQGGFWLEAVGDTVASTEAAAACAAAFNA